MAVDSAPAGSVGRVARIGDSRTAPSRDVAQRQLKIAINGCGIAGPALAYWLLKAGHEPVLVERAPRLRSGGYVIDFWGLGYDLADRMGLIPRLRELGYQVEDVRFVDAAGRRSSGFSTDVLRRITGNRFTSLSRSDLAATLYSTIERKVETVFGDSIASIDDLGNGLRVSFDHAEPRAFDLVVGADGLHSRVRRIMFGSGRRFEVPLGLHVAAFEAEGYRPRDERAYVSHTRPGRQISRFALRDDRTLFLFVFRDELLGQASFHTEEECKAALRTVFGSDRWETPAILAEMEGAREIYFDRVSQVRMASWTRGRAALIGDAAASVSFLAGEGAGLAIASAYVLAGELDRSRGEHVAAFVAYQDRMMPLLRRKQQMAERFASAFAPRSAAGIAMRDLAAKLLRWPYLAKLLIGHDLRDDIELPTYFDP